MYDNFIFDLYGTLADIRTNEDSSFLWVKLSELYRSYGAMYSPLKLKRAYTAKVKEKTALLQARAEESGKRDFLAEPDLTEVFQELYTDMGVACDRQRAAFTANFFRIASRKYLRLYPYVRETLTELKERGKGVYLLSNAQSDFTRPELVMLGIDKLFDGIAISSEMGVKKPSPEFFRLLLEKYNLNPEKCLMTGNDELSDIIGAGKVGIDGLYIHTKISPEYKGIARPKFLIMSGDWKKVRRILLKA